MAAEQQPLFGSTLGKQEPGQQPLDPFEHLFDQTQDLKFRLNEDNDDDDDDEDEGEEPARRLLWPPVRQAQRRGRDGHQAAAVVASGSLATSASESPPSLSDSNWSLGSPQRCPSSPPAQGSQELWAAHRWPALVAHHHHHQPAAGPGAGLLFPVGLEEQCWQFASGDSLAPDSTGEYLPRPPPGTAFAPGHAPAAPPLSGPSEPGPTLIECRDEIR